MSDLLVSCVALGLLESLALLVVHNVGDVVFVGLAGLTLLHGLVGGHQGGHLGALLAIGVGDLALVLVLNLALLRVLVVTFLHTQMVTFEYILLLMLIKVTSLYSVLQFSFSNRWQFFSYSISTSKSS